MQDLKFGPSAVVGVSFIKTAMAGSHTVKYPHSILFIYCRGSMPSCHRSYWASFRFLYSSHNFMNPS